LGFLEVACWKALTAVPTPIPNRPDTSRHDAPDLRRRTISAASTTVRGRPRRTPRACAAANPEMTLPRINSRSNSAMLAKIPNTDLDETSCKPISGQLLLKV